MRANHEPMNSNPRAAIINVRIYNLNKIDISGPENDVAFTYLT